MVEQPWPLTAITVLSPLLIALLSAEALKYFLPRTRLEKQIRTLSELITTAGADPSAAGLRSLREHTTALYVSRTLVKGYPWRVVFAFLTALGGLAFLAAGLLLNHGGGQLVGVLYISLGVGLIVRILCRTQAFRNRTYRALRAGRPSAYFAIDIDLSPARNVRRANKIRSHGVPRSRRKKEAQ